MKRLLKLSDWTQQAIADVATRANEFAQGAKSTRALGKHLVQVFAQRSLRTRLAMERAWTSLGGVVHNLSLDETYPLAWGSAPMRGVGAEHVEEFAEVLRSIADVVAARDTTDSPENLLAGLADHLDSTPLVSLESSFHHPLQALVDRVTLDRAEVPREGVLALVWCSHPRELPRAVANSTVLMAAQRGMQVRIVHPPGRELDAEVINAARSYGVSVTAHNERDAVVGADVVYAKSWGGRRSAPTEDWCVGRTVPMPHGARLMHCLPVRRDIVVSAAHLRAEESLVLEQLANRVPTFQSILEAVVEQGSS